MGSADVAKIEEDIFNIAHSRRIRPSEYFVDYDRLRSGAVTETQFFRVLWENLGVKLSEEEERALASKYARRDGRTDWRKFCDTINMPFNSKDLHGDPRCQKIQPDEFFGTMRSVRPIHVADECRLEELLRKLQTFYAMRGINLRRTCSDFDSHNLGVINESQFFRSLPRMSDTTEEEIALLVDKYKDHNRPAMVNYLNLANDLDAVAQKTDDERKLVSHSIVDLNDYLPHKVCKNHELIQDRGVASKRGGKAEAALPMLKPDIPLQSLFDRIRIAVFRNGVRTTEFFKDYDKLRSGLITERQFLSALVLSVGKEAQLEPADCQKVVEFYRAPDGRVFYREFCDMLENAFNVPYLEKKPTETVVRPPSGSLGRTVPLLTAIEEHQVGIVLDTLRNEVERRRISLYQYFKDFDRSQAYTRVVTPTQFARVLHFLSLSTSPENFRLLCRKFADETTGDINYPAFVQSVDKLFVNYTMDRLKGYEIDKNSRSPTCVVQYEEEIEISQLMARIRHLVLVNRLRIVEFFGDFDPLRSGSVSKTQFERSLSLMGLSSIGHHHLSEGQLQALCHLYENPNDRSKVVWIDFAKDVDSVFTLPNLDKNPSAMVPPSEIYEVPKPGTMDWRFASEEQKEYTNAIIKRLSTYIRERRSLIRPFFKDFDKHNNGHLSRSKFRQAISISELHCTEAEMQSLEARFANDVGVNYVTFLDALEHPEPIPLLYIQRVQDLRAANQRPSVPEREPAGTLEDLLLKIKTKVCKERVRIYEWTQDYDKRRTGRMLKTQFRRALDLCNLELQESELSILEDHYRSAGEPLYVDYLRFSNDIEAAFTTHHLEKMPTLEPQIFHPPHQIMLNELDRGKQNMLEVCLDRVADRVKVTRIQLFPLFEDFDRNHIGSVTQGQFRRVLDNLQLAQFAPTETEWVCMFDKFLTRVGRQHDVNYVDFCDEVYRRAGFAYRLP